jgi:hypothetical protein
MGELSNDHGPSLAAATRHNFLVAEIDGSNKIMANVFLEIFSQ